MAGQLFLVFKSNDRVHPSNGSVFVDESVDDRIGLTKLWFVLFQFQFIYFTSVPGHHLPPATI